MKYKNLLLACVIILMSINNFADVKVNWYKFDEGVNQARESKKIILIDFYTEWCGWCKRMDKDTYSNSKIIKLLKDNFISIKLNPEKDAPIKVNGKLVDASDFAKMAGIRGFPATGFYDSELNLLNLTSGYYPPEKFESLLTFIIENTK